MANDAAVTLSAAETAFLARERRIAEVSRRRQHARSEVAAGFLEGFLRPANVIGVSIRDGSIAVLVVIGGAEKLYQLELECLINRAYRSLGRKLGRKARIEVAAAEALKAIELSSTGGRPRKSPAARTDGLMSQALLAQRFGLLVAEIKQEGDVIRREKDGNAEVWNRVSGPCGRTKGYRRVM